MSDLMTKVRATIKASKAAVENDSCAGGDLTELKGVILDTLDAINKSAPCADAQPKQHNHAFTFAFSVVSAASCENDDDYPSAAEVRHALLNHLASVDDAELMENVGVPFDSFEVE